MASPYVTGPVHIYVGLTKTLEAAGPPIVYAQYIPWYLGTCEVAPAVQLAPKFEPLMNDLAGSQIPYDYLYQGEDAMVIGDLTVWNEDVYTDCLNRANATTVGTNEQKEIGSLMLTEDHAFPIWLVYSFGGKATFTDKGMPSGMKFIKAFVEGPDDWTIGTRANKRHIVFHAIREYVAGTFTLYQKGDANDWDTATAAGQTAAKGTGTAFAAVTGTATAVGSKIVPIIPPTQSTGNTQA